MATARSRWMFRAAAVLLLTIGANWLWVFGFTDYHPEHRIYGLAAGAVSLVWSIFLFRGSRPAILLSAAAALTVSFLCAILAPRAAGGPAILVLAALGISAAVYAVLAFRYLFPRVPQGKAAS